MWKTRASRWRKLDNAAKIFPALAGREDAEVFRFSCQLKEEVIPELLQIAVDRAAEEYPTFTQTIRRGVFWYYLEDTGLKPIVHEESKTPLCPLYKEGNRLLIDVSYYKNRINLELFHAIADGTGAFVFLRVVVMQYLKLAHPDRLQDVEIEAYDHTERQKASDGFTQYYTPDKGSPTSFEFLGDKTKSNKVYHFDERKTADYRQHLTEGLVSASKVKGAAAAYGATVTEFVCAVLILSIYDTMEPRDRSRRVSVAIPVNLRNYFDSGTLRNFFGMIQVSYDFSEKTDHSLAQVIKAVRAEFKRELTYENMQQKIASQVKMERHPIVRICPLFLKDLVVIGLQAISNKRRTICLSNMGKVALQAEFETFVDYFAIFNSSASRQMCMGSFGDNMTLNFSGVLAEHDVERSFFRRMAEYDSGITVSASYSPGEAD